MKKTVYISPETEVITLKAPIVLQAGSPNGSGSTSTADDPEPATPGDY